MKPRITLRGVGLSALAWAVFALLGTIPLATGAPIPYTLALISEFSQNFFLAALSVIPWLLVIRGMDGKKWVWIIAVHVVLAPVYAITSFTVYAGYLDLIAPNGSHYITPFSQWIIFSYITVYLLQFAIYHGIQIMARLRQKEQEALVLAVLAKEQELSALKSQINPHFLFNTLNSISAVASRDAEETRTMIAELGDLFRYATEISKRDVVPLQEELGFTKSFLSLESKRIGDRLQIEYRIAPEALNHKVPPLIFQPLVENAIKHGIEPSETGGKVSIIIEVHGSRLMIRIVDTGVGARPNDVGRTEGIGLRNTDLRLRTLYGDSSALQTRTPEGGGFEVTFSIPIDPEVK
jgi:two-component system, LytTR family, sensor kinase